MFLNQSFDHNFGRFLPSLGDFYQVWAIFTNFGRFLPILGDFYQFWAIFTNFGRFLPILGDFYQFWAKALAIFYKNQCYYSNDTFSV
jgi:hypothetical protein